MSGLSRVIHFSDRSLFYGLFMSIDAPVYLQFMTYYCDLLPPPPLTETTIMKTRLTDIIFNVLSGK